MNTIAGGILLLAIALGSCRASAQAAGSPPPARMNVLLMVSEDNGPQLGCYGDTQARTPRLDRLAEEGVLFRTAYTTASVCSPARASILTGMYPHENGQMGLATHKHQMYRQWPNMVSLLGGAGYRVGMLGKLHINPASAFPLDMHAFSGSNFNKRPMGKMTARAMEFIDEGDEPFLLIVNFPDAHFPLLDQYGGLPESPRGAEDMQSWLWLAADSERLRGHIASYSNCMERLDGGVGLLLDGLESRGLTDNTLIIYVADHGPQFSRGKTSAYEPGLRVPMIVRAPGGELAGTTRGELVSIVDLLPTVLDYTGVDREDAKLSGRSLRPLVEGYGGDDWREYLVGLGLGGAPVIYFPQYGIRDQRYKLVVSPVRDRPNTNAVAYKNHHNAFFVAGTEDDEIDATAEAVYERYLHPPEVELYDLREDPDELVDLAGSATHQAIKRRLVDALERWQDRTNDPLGDPDLLARFSAINDELLTKNYKKDKSFRWPHLAAWERFVCGENEELEP